MTDSFDSQPHGPSEVAAETSLSASPGSAHFRFRRPAGTSPTRLNTARLDTQNEENPARTNEWVRASDEGMAPVLTEYVFRHGAHWRYDGTEKPVYGPCVCCGECLRVDRLDLVVEHLRVCARFVPSFLRYRRAA